MQVEYPCYSQGGCGRSANEVRLRDTFRHVGQAHISGECEHGGDDVGKIGELGLWKLTLVESMRAGIQGYFSFVESYYHVVARVYRYFRNIREGYNFTSFPWPGRGC